MESANKLVVEARLKGARMHWQSRHVNSLLALRNGVSNHLWQETWHLAGAQQSSYQVQRRTFRVEQRKQAQLSSGDPLPAKLSSPACHPTTSQKAPACVPTAPAATPPVSCLPYR
jgi:hypothetical protein